MGLQVVAIMLRQKMEVGEEKEFATGLICETSFSLI